MSRPLKIGIFGGTFDPIHYGHLRIAETLREVYALEEVRFIPTGLPPHRVAPNVSGKDRLQMTQLASAAVINFIADPREILRQGRCYTVDTLLEIQRENPAAQLVWLLGTDAFIHLMQWHRWQELLDDAHVALVARPGVESQNWQAQLPNELAQQYEQRLVLQDTMPYQVLMGKISLLPTIPLDISATLLRRKIVQGESVRFLTSDAVIDYIEQHGLYR